MPNKVSDEITDPLTDFIGGTIDVWDENYTVLVKGSPGNHPMW